MFLINDRCALSLFSFTRLSVLRKTKKYIIQALQRIVCGKEEEEKENRLNWFRGKGDDDDDEEKKKKMKIDAHTKFVHFRCARMIR